MKIYVFEGFLVNCCSLLQHPATIAQSFGIGRAA